MKLKTLLFLSISVLSGTISKAQTTGGPDLFGYHWANNLDLIGSAPVYSWKNIKGTGTLVTGLGDDNSSGSFYPNFYFNYYGKWVNTIWIGSNGWTSFQPQGSISAPFSSIPDSTSGQGNFIAPMLADLTMKDASDSVVPGAAVYFWTNNSDSVIIQYDSIPFWDSSSTGYSGRSSFQVILAGTDHSITFQYKQIINSTPAYNLTVNGLKSGIQDSTGYSGLQVLSDVLPSNSSAVKFFYPGHFSTNDINNNTLSLGQNFPNPCNTSTHIQYSITNSEIVTLTVQNILGEQIENRLIGKSTAGKHSIPLNTANYMPGIYFYTLSIDGASASGKMIVEK